MPRSSCAIVLLGLAACGAFAAEKAKQEFEAVAPPVVEIQMQPPERVPADEIPPDEESEHAEMAPPSPAPDTPDFWQKGMEGLNKELDQLTQAPSTAEAPATTSAPRGTARSMIQGIVATCVVVALILALYYLVNRYGKKTPMLAGTSLGQIMGRVHLGPRASLMFVKVRDRVLVVGVTPNEISRVAEFEASMFVEGAMKDALQERTKDSPSDAFMQELKRAQAPTATTPDLDVGGDEWITAMRQDLQRFQENLKEFTRDVER